MVAGTSRLAASVRERTIARDAPNPDMGANLKLEPAGH